MPKLQPNSILSALVSAAVIGAVILVMVIAAGMIRSHNSRAEYSALLEELEKDPIAVRLRGESDQRCDRVGHEFYWMCGVVIKAKPFSNYGYCSTAERPLYYGHRKS